MRMFSKLIPMVMMDPIAALQLRQAVILSRGVD